MDGSGNLSGRDLIIQRLKTELSILDRHWEDNRSFKIEFEKFVHSATEREETASQVCDQVGI